MKKILFIIVPIIITPILIVMLLAGAFIADDNSNDSQLIGGGMAFDEAVMSWEPAVRAEAERNEVSHLVNVLLAIIQVETRGNAEKYPDIMQASESQGWAPNTISDPYQSIEVGVKYFADMYKNHEDYDLLNIVQAFNYGGGFLSYSGQTYQFEKAVSFASERANGKKVSYTNSLAISMGYDWRYAYGNMFYSQLINQYLQSGGVIISDGQFALPVGGDWRMTSPFGPRVHPVTGVSSLHKGIDLVTDIANAPIYAIADGTVVFSDWATGYGNYIVIQHDETTFSGYGHNRGNLVSVGDKVVAGQQIAVMGTTGVSTGVHLHLNIMVNTTDFWQGYVDPAPLIGIAN